MKIGLVDVDGHNFPNVALMKIASWHRQQGDTLIDHKETISRIDDALESLYHITEW